MGQKEQHENLDSLKAIVENTVRYMYPCYRLLGVSRSKSIKAIINELEARYGESALTELHTTDYVAHVIDKQKRIDTPRGLITLTAELNRAKFYGWEDIRRMANHISHIYFQGVENIPFLSDLAYDGIEKRAIEGQAATNASKRHVIN